MNDVMQGIVGFVLGFCIPPGLVWLIFVYPYSEVSLKMFGVLFGFGVLMGLVAVGAYLLLWSNGWSGD